MIFIYATLGLWLFFIIAANFKEKYEAGHLDDGNILIGKILLTAFFIGDVLYNVTLGTILFLDKPVKNYTLSHRLKHYLRTEPDSWRGKVALFMCKYMIEPWLPGHCYIGD